MSMLTTRPVSRTWQRPRLIQNSWLRWGLWVGVAGYLVLALGTLEMN